MAFFGTWTRKNKRPADEVEIDEEKGKRTAKYWRLLSMCIGEQGCNIMYWRVVWVTFIGEILEGIYWWDIRGLLKNIVVFWYYLFAGLMWYLHRRYPKRSKTHQWKMLAYLPPGLPGTLSADCIESVLLAMVVQYLFIFICWLFHECIRASATFLGQKPAEPKGPPRQWPSNV